MGQERKDRFETNPLSVAERLLEVTLKAPQDPQLRKKMEDALEKLDEGLPPLTDDAVRSTRMTF